MKPCLLLACLLVCCRMPSVVKPPSDGGTCRTACAKLYALGCEEGKDGCEPFCEAAAESAGAIDLEIGCISNATSVAEVRLCRVDCKEGPYK